MTFKEFYLMHESHSSAYGSSRQEELFPHYKIRSPQFKSNITNPKNFLYHVTNRKNLKSIMQHGLLPSVGEMVDTFYGDEEVGELTELVFFSETPRTHYASAPFEKANLDDIVLCMVHKIDNDELMQWDGERFRNYKKEVVGVDLFFPQVETGDWVSMENIWPDYVLFGPELAAFLKKFFPKLAKFGGH